MSTPRRDPVWWDYRAWHWHDELQPDGSIVAAPGWLAGLEAVEIRARRGPVRRVCVRHLPLALAAGWALWEPEGQQVLL